MAAIVDDFNHQLSKLLKETFEAGGRFYLEDGAGLFPTLDTITHEVASRVPFPGAPSIAAHCAHVDYYVRVNRNAIVGREENVDWSSSWRLHAVGAGEWADLKNRLRSGYDELTASLHALTAWRADAVCDGMAIVAHTAYHLGAIRQIRRLLESSGHR